MQTGNGGGHYIPRTTPGCPIGNWTIGKANGAGMHADFKLTLQELSKWNKGFTFDEKTYTKFNSLTGETPSPGPTNKKIIAYTTSKNPLGNGNGGHA